MLWLVGLMGSGKSTIGPLAADLLGVSFVDTDDLVVSRSGRSIPALFAEGEASFRAVEAEVITDVAGGAPCVVATGGGAVMDEGNRSVMRESGTVVWLSAPPEILAARVGDGEGRPLLAKGEATANLETLAAERALAYAAAAHVVVQTGGREITDVVQEVVAAWPVS